MSSDVNLDMNELGKEAHLEHGFDCCVRERDSAIFRLADFVMYDLDACTLDPASPALFQRFLVAISVPSSNTSSLPHR